MPRRQVGLPDDARRRLFLRRLFPGGLRHRATPTPARRSGKTPPASLRRCRNSRRIRTRRSPPTRRTSMSFKAAFGQAGANCQDCHDAFRLLDRTSQCCAGRRSASRSSSSPAPASPGSLRRPRRSTRRSSRPMPPTRANGERIFYAGGCTSCHAAPGAKGDEKLKLAGGLELKTDFGTFPRSEHLTRSGDRYRRLVDARFRQRSDARRLARRARTTIRPSPTRPTRGCGWRT